MKGLKVNKVDFVDKGANLDAHITLYKNKDGQPGKTQEGRSGNAWRVLSDLFRGVARLKPDEMKNTAEKPALPGNTVPSQERMTRQADEGTLKEVYSEVWDVCFALASSLCSIVMEDNETEPLMRVSLNEFMEAVSRAIARWSRGETFLAERKTTILGTEPEREVMKLLRDRLDLALDRGGSWEISKHEPETEGDSEDMRIDKSRMTPVERAFYEEIVKRFGLRSTLLPTRLYRAARRQPRRGTGYSLAAGYLIYAESTTRVRWACRPSTM